MCLTVHVNFSYFLMMICSKFSIRRDAVTQNHLFSNHLLLARKLRLQFIKLLLHLVLQRCRKLVRGLDAYSEKGNFKSPNTKHSNVCAQTGRKHYVPEKSVEKTYASIHPVLLKHLSHTHSSWIFGAIAELVDNARDAKATKLKITIQPIKKHGKEIQVLSAIDNGHGMSHQELQGMFSLGCKTPNEDDPSRIGIFGTGFMAGSMGIGEEALVLTQTAASRSVGLLSPLYNVGNTELEIPIISYCKEGPLMEVDTTVNSKAKAELYLNAIKDFSHFNEYYIGALFHTQDTGTQVHIWNLKKYGSDYCLDWQDGKDTGLQGDITIRSMNCRLSEGQIRKKVPLDYSLHSYLAVIFLDSSMEISVQGSVVETGSLVTTLDSIIQTDGVIMGKPVKLILGRSKLEHEQQNCGVFIYWHGRLVEAYKRVGGMVHNADKHLGIIGVIDVTDLMNGGHEVVCPDKQKFVRSNAYVELEAWLGLKADEYSNNNSYKIKTKCISEGNKSVKKQCGKCQKWRSLRADSDLSKLPAQWYCYMPPFCRTCDFPLSPDHGETSVGSKCSREYTKHTLVGESSSSRCTKEGMCRKKLKRLKKGS